MSETVAELCAGLQSLQRVLSVTRKTRIMVHNRNVAVVAGTIGYCAGLAEKDRRRLFREAEAMLPRIESGEVPSLLQGPVTEANGFVRNSQALEAEYRRAMERRVASVLGPQLPLPGEVAQGGAAPVRGRSARALTLPLPRAPLPAGLHRRIAVAPGVELLIDASHPVFDGPGGEAALVAALRAALAR